MRIFIFLSIFLQACTVIKYKDSYVEFSRYSFGANTNISELVTNVKNDGSRSIQVKGYNSDQTEGLKALAEGAVKGAIGKP